MRLGIGNFSYKILAAGWKVLLANCHDGLRWPHMDFCRSIRYVIVPNVVPRPPALNTI